MAERKFGWGKRSENTLIGKSIPRIDAAVKAYAGLEAQMVTIELKAFAKIYSVLDSEQKQKSAPVFHRPPTHPSRAATGIPETGPSSAGRTPSEIPIRKRATGRALRGPGTVSRK